MGRLVGRLVERRPPWDVGTWVRQVQPAALQGDVDRVCDGGVESLRVVAVRLIHPALQENEEGVKPNRIKLEASSNTVSSKSLHSFLSLKAVLRLYLGAFD